MSNIQLIKGGGIMVWYGITRDEQDKRFCSQRVGSPNDLDHIHKVVRLLTRRSRAQALWLSKSKKFVSILKI